MKHYFLRAVPTHKVSIALACGFVPYEAAHDADRISGSTIWVESAVGFRGPLSGVPRDDVEAWLLKNSIAYEIFVTGKWGAEIDP